MKALTGGLWLASLMAGAGLGILPGLILFVLGMLAGIEMLYQEKVKEQKENNKYMNYPTYKY